MADYFRYWLEGGERAEASKLPRIFYVTWFRKGSDGHFLWPGFGENSRVLEWVFRRCEGAAEAVESPIGYLPAPGAINTDGLDVSEEDMAALLEADPEQLEAELPSIHEHFAKFGDRLPQELRDQLETLEKRLREGKT
jgi:phosphoenolpyruvate carboxykinase (GTP)